MDKDKPVLKIDLGKIPKELDIDEFIEEFKSCHREWSQQCMNEFIESKQKESK